MTYKIFKWVLGIILLWLVYSMFSILSFPVGTLSERANAAIILGAAVHDDEPSPVFKERINHAINLYQAGMVEKLIFTGGIGDSKKHAESSVARKYAINKQVKASDIFIETESLTTKENIVNALQIIEKEKLGSVLLVSDALHLKRAMLMARDLKLNAKASSTPSSRYQSLKTKLPFALRELYFYHHYLLFSE